MKQKGFAPVLILLVGVILGLCIYYFISLSAELKRGAYSIVKLSTTPTPTLISTQTLSPISDTDMSSWTLYRNPDYAYSLKFPNNHEMGSDAGMNFSTNSLYLAEKGKNSLFDADFFGIRTISKDKINKDNLFPAQITSAYDLAGSIFEREIRSKTLHKIIKPLTETTFLGIKAYEFELDGEGIESIYGGQMVNPAKYTSIIFEKSGYYYHIIHSDNSLHIKILSTFKFTQ